MLPFDLTGSRLRWAFAGLVSLSIFLLINLGLLAASPGLFLQLKPEPMDPAATVVSAVLPSSTPYQPLHPTEALDLLATIPEMRPPASATSTPPAVLERPLPPPGSDFFGLDFSPGAGRIKIILQPQNNKVNHGKPIAITVNPGKSCAYQDHRACVNAYRDGWGGNVILVSVHSGIGGEAEAFRRAVEGMGVDRARFSLKQIRSNLARLDGAKVRIVQGQRAVDGLELAAASRVPAGLIREYFRSPADQALRLAASVDPRLEVYTHPEQPILVFETCGWKLEGEPWAPGVTSTSGSVYLGVIKAGE